MKIPLHPPFSKGGGIILPCYLPTQKPDEPIFIPYSVNKEIKSKRGINLPAHFRAEEIKNKFYIRQNSKSLHIGEVEAIALAKEIKTDLVGLDDKKAKKLAEKEGLKVAALLFPIHIQVSLTCRRFS
ncbi:MAG TPA: hypothetical protein ENH38_01920 [Nitrospirae bacterium]|nr:hypothetical protein [Nitrospirota bacterium]